MRAYWFGEGPLSGPTKAICKAKASAVGAYFKSRDAFPSCYVAESMSLIFGDY